MHRPSGNAAVRLTLLALVFASFAMALVQPVVAGTEAAPEIQDPPNDQAIAGEGPGVPCGIPSLGCAAASRIDAVTIWIDNETATTINVNIITTGVPGGATSATSTYNIHATFGGTEVVSTVQGAGGSTVTPPAPVANVESVTVDGNTLIMTIAKSVYGAPAAGGVLTGLFYEGVSTIPSPVPSLPFPVATDRAPNDGAGTDYTFTGGAAPGGSSPDDTDGDGMNDTCEIQYFGNVTAQNATGDPDGDGLTNGQECALGTDPTKADTDGDGVSDKDDPFPTDPTKGGSNGTTSTTSSTSSSHSSTGSSGSRSSSTTGGGNANGSDSKGEVTDLAGAIDRLADDPGYLGMSAGGFLAVLILCIIALAVRWSL